MKRKLIIDGNAVYEIDEDCMVTKRLNKEKTQEERVQMRRRRENNKEGNAPTR